ncbi:hypothetical protein BDQ12DRAFT_691887 [Crucibulum laeve]|uniref:Uncharacterized protein n=1 Tax=Crucibulum laeve TaxID=68775 RepID=A0A5C3LLW6_9AGAR|nr:hypothetical protein BDQ12DRAFT_691887 [Crucibulum laeve]
MHRKQTRNKGTNSHNIHKRGGFTKCLTPHKLQHLSHRLTPNGLLREMGRLASHQLSFPILTSSAVYGLCFVIRIVCDRCFGLILLAGAEGVIGTCAWPP